MFDSLETKVLYFSLPSATKTVSLYSQIPERDNQERRFHEVDSMAYLRSKTVQPTGGSSNIL
jgi:hypothetical protein